MAADSAIRGTRCGIVRIRDWIHSREAIVVRLDKLIAEIVSIKGQASAVESRDLKTKLSKCPGSLSLSGAAPKRSGEEEYEGETTSMVASLVSEHSESGAQALAPAPVRPGGVELGGFRRLGLGRETSDEPKILLRESEAIAMDSSCSSASGVSESSLREHARIESNLWKLFGIRPEPLHELLFRNGPFRISKLGYAMLQSRFLRAEITTRPSLAQASYNLK
ncbi:hypothetical protein B9Z19DRAFT_1126992 [Tuber borchii]|uniref:Uncharacterized protein n=1 Tax=Tuber borchii TaxID=42251 RepID=A0A2T6ZS26_TUBBO|nr:hypothetical protein B9Z19DRAFT_1126992 [Tuber borchii]